MATVREAIRYLLAQCDGARTTDGVGFNKFDTQFAREIVNSDWNRKTEKAALQMLRKYQGQLSRGGFVYTSLEFETKAPVVIDLTPGTNQTQQPATPVGKNPYPWKLDYRNDRFEVWSAIEWQDKAKLLKDLAGSGKFVKDEEGKRWVFLANERFVKSVQGFLKDMAPTKPALDQMLKIAAGELKSNAQADLTMLKVKQIKDGQLDLGVKMPVRYDQLIDGKPFDHQLKAFWIALVLPHVAELMEQGTGKTLVGIGAAGYRYLQEQAPIKRLLVAAPSTVCGNWEAEFNKFADFPHTVAVLADIKKKRWEQHLDRLDKSTGLQVVVVNYESLWEKEISYDEDRKGHVIYYKGLGGGAIDERIKYVDAKGEAIPFEEIDPANDPTPKVLNVRIVPNQILWNWAPDMVILDESQKIKNPEANQSIAAWKIGQRARFRLILTGTPVSQGPLDKWAQYRFLNQRIFNRTYWKLKQEIGVMGGWGAKKVVGYKVGKTLPGTDQPNPYYDKDIHEWFLDTVHSVAFRVTKKEALSLPETMSQEVYVNLEGEQRRIYDKMEQDMLVKFGESERMTAPIVLTQYLRLQQITGGFAPTITRLEDEEVAAIKALGDAKLKAVEDLLDDAPLEKKFVVVCRFVPEVEAVAKLAEKLGRKVVTLTGKTPKTSRTEIIRQFQTDPETTVIVLQIQTGGVGITLTAADTMILYSWDFSFLNYEQVLARIHRIGQKNACTYIHLVAKGTIDEEVLQVLKNKGSMAEMVIDKLARTKEGARMPKPTSQEAQKILEMLKQELESETGIPKGGAGETKKDQVLVDFAGVENDPEEKTPPPARPEKAKSTEPKAERPKAEKKAPVEGPVVTAKELADELGMDDKKLRKLLRKLEEGGLQKPGGRWEWPTDHPDLKKVREALKKGAK